MKRARGRRTSQNSVLVRTVLKTPEAMVFECAESGAGGGGEQNLERGL